METALKMNLSLCVLSPPAWAQPFTVREKAFMHQARAYFPLAVQPDNLTMPATRPLKRQVFMDILIFLRFLLSLKRFCAATGVTANPRIQKEEQGVQNGALQLQRLSVCASTKSTRRTDRLQKDNTHLQVFFQLHQAKN